MACVKLVGDYPCQCRIDGDSAFACACSLSDLVLPLWRLEPGGKGHSLTPLTLAQEKGQRHKRHLTRPWPTLPHDRSGCSPFF